MENQPLQSDKYQAIGISQRMRAQLLGVAQSRISMSKNNGRPFPSSQRSSHMDAWFLNPISGNWNATESTQIHRQKKQIIDETKDLTARLELRLQGLQTRLNEMKDQYEKFRKGHDFVDYMQTDPRFRPSKIQEAGTVTQRAWLYSQLEKNNPIEQLRLEFEMREMQLRIEMQRNLIEELENLAV